MRRAKGRCLEDLTAALPRYVGRLESVDERLVAYVEDALSNRASHANLYELLGIRKVLRLMDTYALNGEKVRTAIRAIEGVWENGRHRKGGLKFDTPRGNMHVRLMPYQVWCLFGIYGFLTDVSMERRYVAGDELLPSEYVKDGEVWDRRRLTSEIHLFQTRKSGKTEFGGAIDFVEVCFLGPANGQALICTNSAEQSQIAYKAIKEFAVQVDPSCINRLGGKYFRMTAKGMNWQPGHRMKGEIRTMAAGKTPKDGLYASVVHADEHGQASYVNGRSDMQSAVETCWGSTGPRREKLLMHTTTAGNLSEGPYKSKIESVEASLLTELDHPLGMACKTPDDYWFAFLLQLDKWEITDDLSKLDDGELFKKVNRSIGTTVQPTYYRERLHEASLSDDTKKEVLTKDFNMWQTDKVTTWIVSADKVRQLQRPMRVTDCRYEDGWSVFVGMDFSSGEDLFAITYFCVNYRDGLEMEDRFFADTEAWVLESIMRESPNRPLYEMWVEQGWLHVCPGEVFNPDYAINKLMEKNEMGVNLMMFGYDPAQSKQPINTLKAWLQSIGLTPEAIKAMVVPVSQSFMTMNPIVGELEHYILTPWIHFSASPLWPWMAGNVNIIYSRDDTLRRLHKSGKHNKIDCFHALLDGIYVFDLSEG